MKYADALSDASPEVTKIGRDLDVEAGKTLHNRLRGFAALLTGKIFLEQAVYRRPAKSDRLFQSGNRERPKFLPRLFRSRRQPYAAWHQSVSGDEPRETIAKAKEAANSAIALDDSLAEAHTSLGFMSYNFDFDWAAAEQHFRRAIELNLNYVTAHHWYGQFLNVVRRFAESEAELKKALQLDPSSLIINSDYGGMFYYSRPVRPCSRTIQEDARTGASFCCRSLRTWARVC
jgi:tetratricopeptide (TPR) repeat protein